MTTKTPLDTSKVYNIEEFMNLPEDGNHYELVEGRLEMMAPAGGEHGDIAGILHGELYIHVKQNQLGKIYAAETGFVILPDTIRGPDVAFVKAGRLPKRTKKAIPLAPDLAVEVVSPNDSWSAVERKVREYQRAGVRLIWVIDPEDKIIHVYRPESHEYQELTLNDFLDGEDVVPGFKINISILFE